MKTRRLHITFLIICLILGNSRLSIAQRAKGHTLTPDEAKTVNKDAGSYFNSGDYISALKGYKELIKANPGNADYNYKLGVSMMMTSSLKDKAYTYLEVASKAKDVKKDVWYYLGMAYMQAGMWDEAIESFNTYKSSTGLKPNKDFTPTEQMIEYCKNGKELMAHPVNVKFENMGKLINTTTDDYNPYISADGKILVYSSRRKGNMGGFIQELGMYSSDILWSQFRDTSGWTKGKGIGSYVNSDWDEETVGLSHDGTQIFIYFDNELAYGDMGLSSVKGRNWQTPSMISVNQPNSMESASCVSNDGKVLYFSSDRKGSEGGLDLYYSVKGSTGDWGPPQNMGTVINTKFDETSPFISLDGQTLYFVSKGHNSMGGFDIFHTTFDSSSAKWSKPKNIGYPINTADDDMSFSMTGNGEYAYVGAIRADGLGDRDIYKITFNDTTTHPFRTVLSGTITAPSTSKVELRNVSLVRKSDKKLVSFYTPYSVSNRYVLSATPGIYILKVDGYGFQPVEEEITVTNEFPPADVVKNFSVVITKN